MAPPRKRPRAVSIVSSKMNALGRKRALDDAQEMLKHFSPSQLHAIGLGHYGPKVARLALALVAAEEIIKAYEDEESAHAHDANESNEDDETRLESLLRRAGEVIVEYAPGFDVLIGEIEAEIGEL